MSETITKEQQIVLDIIDSHTNKEMESLSNVTVKTIKNITNWRIEKINLVIDRLIKKNLVFMIAISNNNKGHLETYYYCSFKQR